MAHRAVTDASDADTADLQTTMSPAQLRTLMAAAATVGAGGTVDDVAAALVDSGVVAVDGTKGVVALLDDTGTHLKLVASSGYDRAYLADWHNFPLDSTTPLADAVRTGRNMVIASVEAFARRYPGVTLPDLQPHALVAVPLHVGARIVGGWGIRLDTGPHPNVEHVAAATAGSRYLSTVASAGITRASTVASLEARVGQLQHALSSRISIEQAKGVLSERHGLTVDEAFEQLRRYARNSGHRVHDIAVAVLDGAVDPVGADGPSPRRQ